jgi:hypothetical protein
MSMIDEHYAPIAFQQYAGDPTGYVIPIYIGCLCLDRTPVTPNVYQSTGPGASDWQLVSGGGGGGPSPATTVVGPDAYGDPAVVGTGLLYARNDHDHGLPAAPIASIPTFETYITVDVSNSGAVMDITSLALPAGTHFVTATAVLTSGGGTYHSMGDIWLGPTTVSNVGAYVGGGFDMTNSGSPGDVATITLVKSIVLPAPATIFFSIYCTAAFTASAANYPGAKNTGITAIQTA